MFCWVIAEDSWTVFVYFTCSFKNRAWVQNRDKALKTIPVKPGHLPDKPTVIWNDATNADMIMPQYTYALGVYFYSQSEVGTVNHLKC